jgi:ribose 5-phosphate isomerase B
MKIILATDHAGFALKEAVKSFLQAKGHVIDDVGTHKLSPDDDYPEYMAKAALKVAEDATGEAKAIIFGYSGQGEAMVANRFPGVRATVYYGGNEQIIKLSREHNDANILSIGAGFVDEAEAKKAIEHWLATPFSGDERHVRRIGQMDSIG